MKMKVLFLYSEYCLEKFQNFSQRIKFQITSIKKFFILILNKLFELKFIFKQFVREKEILSVISFFVISRKMNDDRDSF